MNYEFLPDSIIKKIENNQAPSMIITLNGKIIFLNSKMSEIINNPSNNKKIDSIFSVASHDKITKIISSEEIIISPYSIVLELCQEEYLFHIQSIHLNPLCFLLLVKEINNPKNSFDENIFKKIIQFLSDTNLPYETRTYMNGIIGLSSLLMEPKIPNDKKEYFIKLIQSKSMDYLNSLNALTDISQIDRGLVKIHKEEFFLNDLIDNLYEMYSKKIKLYKNALTLQKEKNLDDIHSIIITDGKKIRQIFIYLLDYVIYKADGKKIIFGYTIQKEDSIKFFIKIQNFEKISNYGIDFNLIAAKELIHLLKGQIEILQQKNEIYFIFNIEYDPINRQTKINKNIFKQVYNFSGIKIAIIEDDPLSSLYLQEILLKTECQLRSFTDGYSFIEELQDYTPDIILLDIQLHGGIDGNKIADKVKKINPQILIIAQTAISMKTDSQKTQKSKFDFFIEKPVNQKTLLNIIENYKKKRGS